MKNKLSKGFLLAVILFAAGFSASAQIYVTIRPPVPVIVRPPQPNPAYIWISEEWEPSGTSYRYSGGQWVAPPQTGANWRQGYWQRTKNGNRWIKGSWAKGANKAYSGNNGVGYGHDNGNGNGKGNGHGHGKH